MSQAGQPILLVAFENIGIDVPKRAGKSLKVGVVAADVFIPCSLKSAVLYMAASPLPASPVTKPSDLLQSSFVSFR